MPFARVFGEENCGFRFPNKRGRGKPGRTSGEQKGENKKGQENELSIRKRRVE
jgi:hypothetical protein